MDTGLDGPWDNAGAPVDVGIVHGGYLGADQCFTRLRNGHRGVIGTVDLRSAVRRNSIGRHGSVMGNAR